jgi:hypothetical protein
MFKHRQVVVAGLLAIAAVLAAATPAQAQSWSYYKNGAAGINGAYVGPSYVIFAAKVQFTGSTPPSPSGVTAEIYAFGQSYSTGWGGAAQLSYAPGFAGSNYCSWSGTNGYAGAGQNYMNLLCQVLTNKTMGRSPAVAKAPESVQLALTGYEVDTWTEWGLSGKNMVSLATLTNGGSCVIIAADDDAAGSLCDVDGQGKPIQFTASIGGSDYKVSLNAAPQDGAMQIADGIYLTDLATAR